ncbi:S phase cyclin A-associated protein in the endoplasmic reticulum-like [Daphnia carinata]|uniref:S phase cyclin A-associated protein in the endoplasmic reticulum-like n=1 Tax=Daphnia carinata TaxID=120202 RepID=UPI00257B3FEF|nr:S phase cyclin A-associated protein in the endoplasmic reticulum-like [Daphnia carinata]XP_059353478.1 S phase cyclin A-associated protein in the endoplasmic reticulum-like [Daphnia carinata]
MSTLDDLEQVRLLVREEGKSARNILAFNVPCVDEGTMAVDVGTKVPVRKPPVNPKSLLVRLEHKVPKLVTVLKNSRSRIRSASAGRDRKSDLQARYWGLLFENLRRAVDEIYLTCESDESVEECKEAIMILESCTKDFRNLIEWLRLKWNYEQTPAPQRPTSLAWEVRKSSPAKPSCASIMGQLQKTPAGLARRILNFEEESSTSSFFASTAMEAKALITTEYPIQTICEAAESLVPKLPTIPLVPQPTPTAARKTISKTGNEAKSSKPAEQASTARVTVIKPKSGPVWKVGKASKNAVNSEVQSLSLANKVQSQCATPRTPLQGSSHKAQLSSITKTQSTQAQSWAQRVQNVPLSQQLSRNKPSKPEPLSKATIKASVARQQTHAPPVATSTKTDIDDGWETVRGRTRSRTSPAKPTPVLTRASTMVYGSRLEARHSAKITNRQQLARSGLLKPSTAQSLPSLCDRTAPAPKKEPIKEPAPASSPPVHQEPPQAQLAPIAAIVNPVVSLESSYDESIITSSDEDKDEAQEAAEVAEEEAEMARREEALTIEEENLQREIRETERSDNEGDEAWDDPINVTPASTPEGIPRITPDRVPVEREVLEEKYHLLLENCSWAEQMELLDQLEEVAAMDGARQPGRALQVHEKLSSPSRRRTAEPCETFQQHEAKQLRAQQHRAAFREEKRRKRRELTKRMEEVRVAKSLLLEEKKLLLERKMKRAEEKRQKHLAEIVKKAHDEESKKREIAFINTIEAQNKQHDFIARIQTQEERIQGLQEERQRRQEERNKAKEALEVRKRALEAERQAKVALLQEKRRQREERIDREHQEKEKERLELAREKQRDREERMSALQAAHQASQSQLQRKIQQKQEESARRHEENIEQIRQKALELSILRFSSAGGADDAPRLVHYETARLCVLCDVQIHSEVILMSHLGGRKHMEALKNHYGGKEPSREQSESSNLKFIVDVNYAADKEAADGDVGKGTNKNASAPETEKEKRAKAQKKRAKKLKSKVMQRNALESSLVPPEGANKHRISRILQELERDPAAHDRHWGEIVRLLEKGSTTEQLVFGVQRGVSVVGDMLTSYQTEQEQGRASSPLRIILSTVNCLRLAARSNLEMSTHIINSQATPLLLSILARRLEILEGNGNGIQASGQLCVSVLPMSDAVATAIMNTWMAIVEPILSNSEKNCAQSNSDLPVRITSLVSYAVSLGLVDRLAFHVGGVGGPLLDEQSASNDLLLASLKFLTSLVDLLHLCKKGQSKKGKSAVVTTDTTQLVEAFQMTELAGVVNALYGLLLHQGAPSSSAGRPAELADNTIRFTVAALQLIYRLALLDLTTFQAILGAEGVSLEFRHIASFLLWYGVNVQSPVGHLLNLTILCIGYFATGHHDNQMILQSGHMPSVLQQLCRLPFGYFSDKALRAILLPTLLACCHDNPANRVVLQKEMSYQMVEDYVNSDDGRAVHLVCTVLNATQNTVKTSNDNSS